MTVVRQGIEIANYINLEELLYLCGYPIPYPFEKNVYMSNSDYPNSMIIYSKEIEIEIKNITTWNFVTKVKKPISTERLLQLSLDTKNKLLEKFYLRDTLKNNLKTNNKNNKRTKI